MFENLPVTGRLGGQTDGKWGMGLKKLAAVLQMAALMPPHHPGIRAPAEFACIRAHLCLV